MARVRLIAAALLVSVLGACTNGSPNEDASGAATSTSVTSSSATECRLPPEVEHQSVASIQREVFVFLACNPDGSDSPELQPVPRLVLDEGAPLRAALNQLLLGATPSEAEAGFVSAYSQYTANALRDVAITNGIATLKLTKAFDSQNNITTNGVSTYAMRQVTQTVFQFPEISGFEVEIDDERWCGWETDCEGQPVPLFARS